MYFKVRDTHISFPHAGGAPHALLRKVARVSSASAKSIKGETNPGTFNR
jgi:hypothetical protein